MKVEHTQAATAELLEVLRPATPGEGMVRADEDAAPGAELVPAGRPLRPQDLGMLAAAGLTEIAVNARPRVTIVSTGDELVPPATPDLPPGRVRDATAPALAALVREAGGDPHFAGIVPDDREALATTLNAALKGVEPSTTLRKGSDPFSREGSTLRKGSDPLEGLLPESDVVVVSAGSSVGARDETAAAIASLGEPGIWCHGLALRPGKPTLLADCGGVPVIGLPGNPRSALVVFRLIGMPIVRQVGGCTEPPSEPSVRARLERDLPSAAGRLDVVQVRVAGGDAIRSSAAPRSSRSSPPPMATSWCRRPRPAWPQAATWMSRCTANGPRHAVHPRPSRRRGARRLGGGLRGRGMPRAARRREAAARGRRRAGDRRARLGPDSSPPFDAAAMDGIAVRAADTVGASETSPVRLDSGAFEVVDTGDPIPGDFDAVVMREDVHSEGDAVELRAAAAPYQHVRSIGEDVSAAELLLPTGHRLRPVDVAAAGAAGATELLVRRQPVVTVIPTGDEIRPVGSEFGEGELPDTNSVMLAAQAEAAGCEAHRFEVTPDAPDRSRPLSARPPRGPIS